MVTDSAYGIDSDFPPIDVDGVRAPLANIREFEDYCIDGSSYSLADISYGNASNNAKNSINNNLTGLTGDEEEDEEPEDAANEVMDSDNDKGDEVSSDEDEEDEDMEEDESEEDQKEYPELSKNGKRAHEEDSYDFSAMDIEKPSAKKKKRPAK